MMGFLRRLRSLAIVLLLASPGLGATWLPVVHPCLVDSPWLTAADGGHHGGGNASASADRHRANVGTSAELPADELCHCIGACQSGTGAALISSPSLAVATVATGWPAIVPLYRAVPPTARHLRLHPPATAPPIA